MKSKQYLSVLLAICCLLSFASLAQAQGEQVEDDPYSAVFGSGFEKLTGEEIHFAPDGSVDVIGRVGLKMTDMSLECNRLTVDPETKILKAIGTPVKIMMGFANAAILSRTLKTSALLNSSSKTLSEAPPRQCLHFR